MLHNEPKAKHRTLPLSHPKGAQKRKTAVFSVEIALISRKQSATKYLVCENRQRQSCKAFIDLSIGAKK